MTNQEQYEEMCELYRNKNNLCNKQELIYLLRSEQSHQLSNDWSNDDKLSGYISGLEYAINRIEFGGSKNENRG